MDLKNNVQRVEGMIYRICGCDIPEAKIVLETCLEKNEERRIILEKCLKKNEERRKNNSRKKE